MASSCLCRISAVLDDMQLLENLCLTFPDWQDELHKLRRYKRFLRVLETLLLCMRKWGDDDDDANLGALVVRVSEFISNLGQRIHEFYLASVDDGYLMPFTTAMHTDEELLSLKQEIKDPDLSSRLSSNSPVNKDDLMDVMDSLLENLGDIVDNYRVDNYRDTFQLFAESTEALQEKLTFLKNFICFVALHGVEDGQLGPLLTHARSVAVSAAYISLLLVLNLSRSLDKLIRNLPQKIIPVEPEVHRTCVKALIASKLSRQQYEEKDEHILRDFIDSLLMYLWEILKTGACIMMSLKNRLKIFYDGLRSLRIILKENPNRFDNQMRDLTGLLLCDAGFVIFSLSPDVIKDGSVKEMDLESFHDFVKRIKLIKATVAESCPETSSSIFPSTNELGFIDFLLNYMRDLTNPGAGSVALVKYPVQTIQQELVFLRSFLGKIVGLRNEDEEVQALWDHVIEVAYKVEFLIDSLLVGDILDSPSISFDSIVEEIETIKSAAVEVFDSNTLDLKVKEVTERLHEAPSHGSKSIIDETVVGFEDESTSIINRLTRGSSQLQIVPIVGMPGLGKTTLAKKVYKDSLVMSHFYTRAWCTASQVYHKKNMFLEILTCIISHVPEHFFKMCEEDLAAEVKRCLLRTRYLIVLDDVWDTEAWNGLEASFPDNRNGSRVILTSRNHDVGAPRGELDEGPHFLRPFSPDESWDLLNLKLCPGIGVPPELCELRVQIVEMCHGLPLMIVILAGILANDDQHHWKELVESLNSSVVSGTEQCTAAVELSYKNLPDNLKPCFLYFGAFPEDHEHTIENLICLWVAEGFALENQLKSAEDVANDYMIDLISRSLIIPSKHKSTGGVKTCRIHDLLHEFCVRKGREERFFQLMRGYDELYNLSVPCNLRRLCISSKPEHFIKSRLFTPTIRSFLFFGDSKLYGNPRFGYSFTFDIIKLVRVLDLSHINLGYTFPRELGLLVLLRYLAILGSMVSIEPFVANLLNLETFVMIIFHNVVTPPDTIWNLTLPDTIWNLTKLRHLEVKNKFGDVSLIQLPTDNLDNAGDLCDLNTFSRVSLSSWNVIGKVLRKFPNIRKLKCSFFRDDDSSWVSADKILVLDFLNGLESLNLSFFDYVDVQCQFEFQFSLTIRKLTLSGFRFPWSKILAIENLPNLEVLKLLMGAFEGEIWNMEEEGFPKVSFLKLASLDIVNWTASEYVDCFPSLRKLVLENCRLLEEIPSGLGSSTLEIIEVSNCPYSASFIRPLQEEQMDMGNTDLKIHISSSGMEY